MLLVALVDAHAEGGEAAVAEQPREERGLLAEGVNGIARRGVVVASGGVVVGSVSAVVVSGGGLLRGRRAAARAAPRLAARRGEDEGVPPGQRVEHLQGLAAAECPEEAQRPLVEARAGGEEDPKLLRAQVAVVIVRVRHAAVLIEHHELLHSAARWP